MRVSIDDAVRERYADLELVSLLLEGVRIARTREDLEAHKRELEGSVRQDMTAESLRDEPRVRAYRDFFWSLGIDPTKTRPAAEALARRVLRGRELPTINTAVDAYNCASVETLVAFAAFDVGELAGELRMRYARAGEPFLGIAMERERALEGRELVIEDGEGLVAVYPYRDADRSKLTLGTDTVLLLGCGVPSLGGEELVAATRRAAQLVEGFCRA